MLDAYRLIVQWLELFKVHCVLASLSLNYRHCVKPIERTAPADLPVSAQNDESLHTNERQKKPPNTSPNTNSPEATL